LALWPPFFKDFTMTPNIPALVCGFIALTMSVLAFIAARKAQEAEEDRAELEAENIFLRAFRDKVTAQRNASLMKARAAWVAKAKAGKE
jgi:hypothetical protein